MSSWPFQAVTEPNIKTGLVAVPAVATAITAANPVRMMSAFFNNPTAATIKVSVTDAAGNTLIAAVEVPPGLPYQPSVGIFPETNGLKWFADNAGLLGEIEAWS